MPVTVQYNTLVPTTVPGLQAFRLSGAVSRQVLCGFVLTGMLMSLVGPLLPAWGYLKLDYAVAGQYFLALAAGVWLGGVAASGLRERHSLLVLWRVSGLLGTAMLLLLSLFGPPLSPNYRQAALFLLGGVAGVVQALVWERLEALYSHNRAATFQLAGLAFGAGSAIPAFAAAVGFLLEGESNVLYGLAILPLVITLATGNGIPEEAPSTVPDPPYWRTPSMVIVRIITWLQFGNEWCVAGWLAIFLVKRIGVNPATALLTTTLYAVLLVLGRIAAHLLLRRVQRVMLLPGSLVATFFGCVFLTTTNNLTGAILGLLLIVAGFSVVLPLAAERAGTLTAQYPAGAYSRSVRWISGAALLVPGAFGHIASVVEIRALLLLPLFGSIAIFGLLLLLSLESKLQELKRARAAAG